MVGNQLVIKQIAVGFNQRTDEMLRKLASAKICLWFSAEANLLELFIFFRWLKPTALIEYFMPKIRHLSANKYLHFHHAKN